MAHTQNALVGGLVVVNMFGYVLGRSGIHRLIRHECLRMDPEYGWQLQNIYWLFIDMSDWIFLFWAKHLMLLGFLSFLIPTLIAILLIAKERYISGWIALMLFTIIFFGSGCLLWIDSLFSSTF